MKKEFRKIDPSLCTEKQVEEACGIVGMKMERLIASLARVCFNNHYVRKWHDIGAIKRSVANYGDAIKDIPPQLVLFAEFLYWCHDIGRLVEGCSLIINSFVTVPVEYENHGSASVSILEQLGVLMLFDGQARNAIEYAISHHQDRFLPCLRKKAGKKARAVDFFARLLRDLDMAGGLINKTNAWMNDRKRMAREMKQHNICGPMGGIFPVSILEDFKKFRPIDTNIIRNGKCSWEGYMLCHMAWIFNISFIETIELLVNLGIIDDYFDYFKAHLPAEQYQEIEQTVKSYLRKQGVEYVC